MTDAPVDAKKRLESLGVPFSEQNFLDHVKSGDTEIVSLMLAAGVRATARNNHGLSAIILASQAQKTEIVKLLLENGACLEDLIGAANNKAKEKDTWEKLASVAPVATIISGLLIAAVGGWFTNSYNNAQVKNLAEQQREDEHIKEIEIVEKMIPHLAGDAQSQRAALVAISVLTDKTLSTKLAEVYQGNGSVDFLQQLIVSSNSTPNEKSAALEAIVHVLDAYRPGIVKVTGKDEWTSGFVAQSENGKATIVTATYNSPGPFTVETWDGHSYSARILRTENELTYLAVDAPDLQVLKQSTLSPEEGMRIIGVGFFAGGNLNVQLGTIRSANDSTLTANYDGSKTVLKGFGGSPILDSSGGVLGIAYAFQNGSHIIQRYKSTR